MYIDEKYIEIAIIAFIVNLVFVGGATLLGCFEPEDFFARLAFTSVLTIIFAYTIRRAEEAITNDNKRKRGE